MFSNLTVGIVLGIGFGGWVFAKLHRSTGQNNQSALIGGVICGLIACLVATTLLSMLFKN